MPAAMDQTRKYLVFEDALLSLFRQCRNCQSNKTKLTKVIKGTFLEIKQMCNLCQHVFQWSSQPYIASIPAGNLLLSASILFSGAIPSQALRILNFLGCVSITQRTFFRHQTSYPTSYCDFSMEERSVQSTGWAENTKQTTCYRW